MFSALKHDVYRGLGLNSARIAHKHSQCKEWNLHAPCIRVSGNKNACSARQPYVCRCTVQGAKFACSLLHSAHSTTLANVPQCRATLSAQRPLISTMQANNMPNNGEANRQRSAKCRQAKIALAVTWQVHSSGRLLSRFDWETGHRFSFDTFTLVLLSL